MKLHIKQKLTLTLIPLIYVSYFSFIEIKNHIFERTYGVKILESIITWDQVPQVDFTLENKSGLGRSGSLFNLWQTSPLNGNSAKPSHSDLNHSYCRLLATAMLQTSWGFATLPNVFHSREDFQNFLNYHSNSFATRFDGYSLVPISSDYGIYIWKDVAYIVAGERFDNEFFKENFLILVTNSSPSTGFEVGINSLRIKDDTLAILLDVGIPTGPQGDIIIYEYFLISVPVNYYKDNIELVRTPRLIGNVW